MTNPDLGYKHPERQQVLQLNRLERVMDVVFALVIFALFDIIPRPGVVGVPFEATDVGSYFSQHWLDLVIVLVGIIVTIIYWLQNNYLFGKLARTDWKHTAISLAQTFLLLVFLYSLRFGVVTEPGQGSRVFESLAAGAVGLASYLGWRYAAQNRRLVHDDVPDEEVDANSKRFRAEPLTAALTIPFAFLGPWLWEISWFLYPIVVAIVKKRKILVQKLVGGGPASPEEPSA